MVAGRELLPLANVVPVKVELEVAALEPGSVREVLSQQHKMGGLEVPSQQHKMREMPNQHKLEIQAMRGSSGLLPGRREPIVGDPKCNMALAAMVKAVLLLLDKLLLLHIRLSTMVLGLCLKVTVMT